MNEPVIAFIIPAYNASETLGACLESILAQTFCDWQAVVVDDGSSDATFETASRFAASDPRIIVVRQENAGAAAARNTAVSRATAHCICMLDSDDWIDPDFLEKMLPPAQTAGANAISYCSSRKADASGREFPVDWVEDLSGDAAKEVFSRVCALSIHCAVLPRALYLQAGGMNTQLATCEDWELWLRIAFNGATFVPVNECLGYYRMREGSLSGNPANLVRNSVHVVALGRELKRTDPATVDIAESNPDTETNILVWYVSMFAGRSVEPAVLAAFLPAIYDYYSQEDSVAEIVIAGLKNGLGLADSEAIFKCRSIWQPAIEKLFSILEAASLAGLARRLSLALVRKIVSGSGAREPWQFGPIFAFPVDVGSPRAVLRPAGADLAVASLWEGDVRLGIHELPLFGDFSVRDQSQLMLHALGPRSPVWPRNVGDWARFSDAAARHASRRKRALARAVVRPDDRREQLRAWLKDVKIAAAEKSVLPAMAVPGDNADRMRAIMDETARGISAVGAPAPIEPQKGPDRPSPIDGHAGRDKQEFWEDVFEKADPWDYLSRYETVKYWQTLSLLPETPITKALEIACAEGIFTEKLADRVGQLLAVDISVRALERAAERCAAKNNITFGPLNIIKDEVPGGQDLIVCSEVLYYLSGVDELRQVARKFYDALSPGGMLLTAHAHLLIDEPERTGFTWGDTFGVRTIRDTLLAIDGLVLEETVDTDLYAIHRFRKLPVDAKAQEPTVRHEDMGLPLTPAVAKYAIWGGVEKLRDVAWMTETSNTVPVLMYHRIADDGPTALERYRTSPEVFEEQMRLLRREGYYSVNSYSLWDHFRKRKPFQGRPILLTFDDAYRDFAENAFPILERNDFIADVFVVTDRVGGRSDWDARFGETAPLMEWEEIADMQRRGIRFGSHLATHTPASGLSSEDLLTEALRSKLTLERRLDGEISSIALPYGAYDSRVTQILRHCGYQIAFSTRVGPASAAEPILELPRLEVRGGIGLDEFSNLLEGKP